MTHVSTLRLGGGYLRIGLQSVLRLVYVKLLKNQIINVDHFGIRFRDKSAVREDIVLSDANQPVVDLNSKFYSSSLSAFRETSHRRTRIESAKRYVNLTIADFPRNIQYTINLSTYFI